MITLRYIKPRYCDVNKNWSHEWNVGGCGQNGPLALGINTNILSRSSTNNMNYTYAELYTLFGQIVYDIFPYRFLLNKSTIQVYVKV